MLKINNLCARVEQKEILKGIDLEIEKGKIYAIMGPNGSGKSTLSSVLAGNPVYEVTSGTAMLDDKNLLELKPEERAALGLFLAFQYPIEIPGVSINNFMKTAINEQRKYRGEKAISPSEFLKLTKEKKAFVGLDSKFDGRNVNQGFSGGEKKRLEVFQMAMLDPKIAILDETDSGLDVDALRIVADGVNKMRSPERSFIIITHYQKLLDYIQPDVVYVLYNGKIIKTGDKNLALEIEKNGFEQIKKEADSK